MGLTPAGELLEMDGWIKLYYDRCVQAIEIDLQLRICYFRLHKHNQLD